MRIARFFSFQKIDKLILIFIHMCKEPNYSQCPEEESSGGTYQISEYILRF